MSHKSRALKMYEALQKEQDKKEQKTKNWELIEFSNRGEKAQKRIEDAFFKDAVHYESTNPEMKNWELITFSDHNPEKGIYSLALLVPEKTKYGREMVNIYLMPTKEAHDALVEKIKTAVFHSTEIKYV